MRRSICIVIPTYNRNDLLQRTLDSLAECERPTAPVTLFIAENGGKCGADVIARSAAPWLNVQYRYSERPNKSQALNQLLNELGDELVTFFDDDVRFATSTLVAYEQAAASYGPGTYFGGPMGIDYEVQPPEWLTQFLPQSATGLPIDRIDTSKAAPFLGCNWAAYAEDLKRCGGFNTAVGPGGSTPAVGQETEMQTRLTRAGVQPRIVENAFVWHYVPEDRCSANWAVHRAYRYGVSVGLDLDGNVSRLMGYPRWMIRPFAKKLIRYLVTRASLDPVRRFDARVRLANERGRLHGARRRHIDGGSATKDQADNR